MSTVAVAPSQTGIAHDAVLTSSQTLSHVLDLDIAGSHQAEGRRSLKGQVVVLVGVDQREVEVLTQGEVAVELVARRNAEADHTVTGLVAVLAVAELQDAQGVGQAHGVGKQLAVVLKHLAHIGIGIGQIVALVAVDVEGVGSEEGRLDQREEAGRRDGTYRQVLFRTVVAQVAVDVAIGSVEAHAEVADDLDVAVQSHVEAREVVATQRSIAQGVAHREVVVGYIVTTLHVDAVVGDEGVVIDLVRPVGIIMIGIIIIIGGIAVDEFQVLHVAGKSREHLGSIEAIVLGTHHLGLAGHQLELAVDGHVNLGGHAAVALGLDEHHTGSGLGAIDGGSVLQYGDALNIVHIQVGQDIVVISLMQHLAVVLHVGDDTVDDNQRLGVGLQTGDTADEHGVAHAQLSATRNGMDVGTQLLGYQRVDAQTGRVVEVLGRTADTGLRGRLIDGTEGTGVELGVSLAGLGSDGFLQQLIALNAHADAVDVLGYFQLVATLVVGHGGVTMIAVCLDDDTSQRLACGGIGHRATHHLHVLLRCDG